MEVASWRPVCVRSAKPSFSFLRGSKSTLCELECPLSQYQTVLCHFSMPTPQKYLTVTQERGAIRSLASSAYTPTVCYHTFVRSFLGKRLSTKSHSLDKLKQRRQPCYYSSHLPNPVKGNESEALTPLVRTITNDIRTLREYMLWTTSREPISRSSHQAKTTNLVGVKGRIEDKQSLMPAAATTPSELTIRYLRGYSRRLPG